MIFGDGVRPASTVASAGWLARSCRGAPGTVGALVPNEYESVLRVFPPPPHPDEWWALYHGVYDVVASIGARHTSSPDRAWFAIWEGHGFDTATTHIAVRGPLDADAQRSLRAQRDALREQDRRRNAAIRTALDELPRLDRPDRTYVLLEGPVSAVTELRDPGSVDGASWRHPDLFWPDDRRWFVATDVDFWSLYIGGDTAFVRELAPEMPTRCEQVAFETRFEIED